MKDTQQPSIDPSDSKKRVSINWKLQTLLQIRTALYLPLAKRVREEIATHRAGLAVHAPQPHGAAPARVAPPVATPAVEPPKPASTVTSRWQVLDTPVAKAPATPIAPVAPAFPAAASPEISTPSTAGHVPVEKAAIAEEPATESTYIQPTREPLKTESLLSMIRPGIEVPPATAKPVEEQVAEAPTAEVPQTAPQPDSRMTGRILPESFIETPAEAPAKDAPALSAADDRRADVGGEASLARFVAPSFDNEGLRMTRPDEWGPHKINTSYQDAVEGKAKMVESPDEVPAVELPVEVLVEQAPAVAAEAEVIGDQVDIPVIAQESTIANDPFATPASQAIAPQVEPLIEVAPVASREAEVPSATAIPTIDEAALSLADMQTAIAAETDPDISLPFLPAPSFNPPVLPQAEAPKQAPPLETLQRFVLPDFGDKPVRTSYIVPNLGPTPEELAASLPPSQTAKGISNESLSRFIAPDFGDRTVRSAVGGPISGNIPKVELPPLKATTPPPSAEKTEEILPPASFVKPESNKQLGSTSGSMTRFVLPDFGEKTLSLNPSSPIYQQLQQDALAAEKATEQPPVAKATDSEFLSGANSLSRFAMPDFGEKPVVLEQMAGEFGPGSSQVSPPAAESAPEIATEAPTLPDSSPSFQRFVAPDFAPPSPTLHGYRQEETPAETPQVPAESAPEIATEAPTLPDSSPSFQRFVAPDFAPPSPTLHGYRQEEAPAETPQLPVESTPEIAAEAPTLPDSSPSFQRFVAPDFAPPSPTLHGYRQEETPAEAPQVSAESAPEIVAEAPTLPDSSPSFQRFIAPDFAPPSPTLHGYRQEETPAESPQVPVETTPEIAAEAPTLPDSSPSFQRFIAPDFAPPSPTLHGYRQEETPAEAPQVPVESAPEIAAEAPTLPDSSPSFQRFIAPDFAPPSPTLHGYRQEEAPAEAPQVPAESAPQTPVFEIFTPQAAATSQASIAADDAHDTDAEQKSSVKVGGFMPEAIGSESVITPAFAPAAAPEPAEKPAIKAFDPFDPFGSKPAGSTEPEVEETQPVQAIEPQEIVAKVEQSIQAELSDAVAPVVESQVLASDPFGQPQASESPEPQAISEPFAPQTIEAVASSIEVESTVDAPPSPVVEYVFEPESIATPPEVPQEPFTAETIEVVPPQAVEDQPTVEPQKPLCAPVFEVFDPKSISTTQAETPLFQAKSTELSAKTEDFISSSPSNFEERTHHTDTTLKPKEANDIWRSLAHEVSIVDDKQSIDVMATPITADVPAPDEPSRASVVVGYNAENQIESSTPELEFVPATSEEESYSFAPVAETISAATEPQTEAKAPESVVAEEDPFAHLFEVLMESPATDKPIAKAITPAPEAEVSVTEQVAEPFAFIEQTASETAAPVAIETAEANLPEDIIAEPVAQAIDYEAEPEVPQVLQEMPNFSLDEVFEPTPSATQDLSLSPEPEPVSAFSPAFTVQPAETAEPQAPVSEEVAESLFATASTDLPSTQPSQNITPLFAEAEEEGYNFTFTPASQPKVVATTPQPEPVVASDFGAPYDESDDEANLSALTIDNPNYVLVDIDERLDKFRSNLEKIRGKNALPGDITLKTIQDRFLVQVVNMMSSRGGRTATAVSAETLDEVLTEGEQILTTELRPSDRIDNLIQRLQNFSMPRPTADASDASRFAEIPPAESETAELSDLHGAIVTETMAKLLAKQGHRDRAIFVYEKLKLKFPEKTPIFEAQINLLKAS